ncbi:hypothetical protein ACFE04_004572 [Oxalis oulophora]
MQCDRVRLLGGGRRCSAWAAGSFSGFVALSWRCPESLPYSFQFRALAGGLLSFLSSVRVLPIPHYGWHSGESAWYTQYRDMSLFVYVLPDNESGIGRPTARTSSMTSVGFSGQDVARRELIVHGGWWTYNDSGSIVMDRFLDSDGPSLSTREGVTL